MTIPRRSILGCITGLCALSLALRYPNLPHEAGFDSFVSHGLALDIVTNGISRFTIHPLSYFGLYPLSQPAGSVFLTANLSQVSAATLEGAILLLDFVVSLIGLLSMFLLTRQVVRDSRLSLVAAAVFSLTPETIAPVVWQLPTRTMFTVLAPLFFWSLLRIAVSKDPRYSIILVGVWVTMMSFHRLTVLMAIVVVALVVTATFLTVWRIVKLQFPTVLLRANLKKLYPAATVLSFFVLAAVMLFNFNVLDEYSAGDLFSGPGITTQLLNLGVSLTRSAGFLLPLMFVGIVSVSRQKNKSFGECLLLVATLLFVPTLVLRQYTGYYTVLITSIFISVGVLSISRRVVKSSTGRGAVVAAFLGTALLSSQAIVAFDLQRSSPMSDATYGTGLYLAGLGSGGCVANDGLMGSRLHAVSGLPYLPIGGATTAFQGPEILLFGYENASTIDIEAIPVWQLTVESDSIFVAQGLQAEKDWALILESPVDQIPSHYSKYHLAYLCENRNFEGKYTAYGNVYSSQLLRSAQSSRYILYEGDSERVWNLEWQ